LIRRCLALCRLWYATCISNARGASAVEQSTGSLATWKTFVELEKRSRVTDAPEIDKTTLRAHFPPTEQRPDSGASVTRLKRKFNNTIEGKDNDEANIDGSG
jgi:hypothetical protein